MEVRNQRWSDDQFKEYLAKVRTWYPTGKDVDLEESVEYHRRMPAHRSIVPVQETAEREGRILCCPRVGLATIEQTQEVYLYARDHGGADFVRLNADTYTRRMEFEKAQKALDESLKLGRSLLNGFPSVAHGVAGNRRLYEAVNLPVSSTCSAAHQELHFLIVCAAGSTDVVGDAFSSLFHEKDTPLSDIIIYTQFVDRLVGWYEARGIPMIRSHKFVGVLTPPAIRAASAILGALMAAEQGCKHFDMVYTVNLCVVQDVAAQRVIKDLCREYLKRFGFEAHVSQGVSHFVGAHPDDQARAFSYIALVAMIARWGGAGRIEGRTVDEGRGIPSMEGQAMSLRAMKEMLYLLRNQSYPETAEVKEEYQVIEREARAIIEKVLDLGDGDVAVGAVKALKTGALDYTYPINNQIAGKVTSVRDSTGAIRLLDCGNLPFTREMKDYHRERIAERKRSESLKDYQLILADLTNRAPAVAVSKS